MDQTPLRVLLKQKGSEIITVEPGTCIRDCINVMKKARVGALLILDAGQLVGIFTERDVLNRVAGMDLDLDRKPVSEVMTHQVATVGPDLTVTQAMQLVTQRRFRHLPIVEHNKLLGLLSSGDLTRWLVSGQELEIEELTKYINQTQRPSPS